MPRPPETAKRSGRWAARLTVILILGFIALVVGLMFLSVRGPR